MSSSSYNNSETNYPTSQDNTVYFATEEQDNIPSSASSFDGASVTASNVFAPSEGAVKYPDASSLDKPTRHNYKHWPFIAVCALVAATFAGVVGYRAYDEIVVEPDAAVARTEAALDAEVDYNIPLLLNVIELADAEMYAALAESGDTFVVLEEYAENTEESDGFDMYRLPESLSQREGSSYLDTGISSLDQDEAATLLNGSWRYTVYRYTSVAVRLQYANFDATDEYTAIAQAMNAQGWLTDEVAEQLAENFGTASVIYSSTPDTDDADAEGEDAESEEVAAEETSDEADESEEGTGEAGTFLFPDITVTLDEYGVDSSGNTYQSGYIVLGELHYQFTIYTVTVEEMYGLDLPRDGMFVGIRLTKIIMDE